MDRSFFRRSSRDTSPLLPQHSSFPLAELPSHSYSDANTGSDQSHVSASPPPFLHPPPPIISSVLLQPQNKSSRPSRPLPAAHIPAPTNPLLALTRREKALQVDLQRFLDAQCASLISDRASAQHGSSAASDAGSSTPTSHSPTRCRDRSQSRNGEVIPVRQPRPKKLSLRGARRGILGAMQELASVKAHMLSILRSESETLRAQLAHIGAWDAKILGFETEMRRIESGGDESEKADLRAEKAAVENEIRELEERLLGLRARERHLGRRLEEASNRREAEMSSFREGRRGVEEEVRRFLGRPPRRDIVLSVVAEKAREEPGEGEEGMTFLALPPKRRTLAMARDWLTFCLNSVSSHTAATEKEKEALQEGALMWESATSLVTTFENELRAQMKEGLELGVKDVKGQLQEMDRIIETLEGTASAAEGRGWNLLICAVGAELEAFKEGRGVLRSILGEPPGIRQDDYGDQKGNDDVLLANSGLTRERPANPATEIRNGNDDELPPHTAADIRNPDEHPDSDPVPPILLDGLITTTTGLRDLEDEDGLTPTAPRRRETIAVGGHARSVSQIYSQSPGHTLLLSHSLRDRDRDRARDLSPYRSESEDDGPPAALLVGLHEEEDYE